MEHSHLDALYMSIERRKDLRVTGDRMRRVYDCRTAGRHPGMKYRLGTRLISLGLKLTGGMEVDV